MSTPALAAEPAALSLRQVGKTYSIKGEDLPVLQRIGLEVARGEFLSIVGASGCGKSTLLRLIAGLDDRFDGDILIEGRPVAGPGVERSLVFQDHRLFPWLSVTDNIALGLDALGLDRQERDARIREQLELVGLAGFAQAYPHQLSGGMAQRAAIARALVSRPDILLMDEPFGALDSITRAHMQEELLRIWRERRVTVVIVTHDVDEAVFLGDRVAVMEPRPGRLQTVVEDRRHGPCLSRGLHLAAAECASGAVAAWLAALRIKGHPAAVLESPPPEISSFGQCRSRA